MVNFKAANFTCRLCGCYYTVMSFLLSQEIALAEAAVLSLRGTLTKDDIFTATSQANVLINKCAKVNSVNFSWKSCVKISELSTVNCS